MTLAADILTHYLKHRDAIHAELSADDLQALAQALTTFAARWEHAEALLNNPLLLERGPERYQAETASFPVLEAMMFAARSISEGSLTDALYRLPSFNNEGHNRTYFIDDLMEKLATQWIETHQFPADCSVKLKWGNFSNQAHERRLMLYLRREKVVREDYVDSGIAWQQKILGEDLKDILRQWEHIRVQLERILSHKTSWPFDADVVARRTADAIIARATPEELELLRGRDQMLLKALHSVLYPPTRPAGKP
jgi:hypothetical protein